MPPFFTLRRQWLIILLLIASLMGTANRAEASVGLRGDRCIVEQGDVYDEDIYFLCRVLEVRGTINGDLVGVASDITIEETGIVTGDLSVAGGKLVVDGLVGDDIRFAGVNATVSKHAVFVQERSDVFSIALNTEIRSEAAVPGDLIVYGYQATVTGRVGGDVNFSGEALMIDGWVGGTVDASVGDLHRNTSFPGLPVYDVSFSNPGLRVGDQARVDGDLIYESITESVIPARVVKGTVNFQQVVSSPDITKVGQADAAAELLFDYVLDSIRDAVLIAIVGVIALRFVPYWIQHPSQHVRRRIVPTVGWGLVVFMLFFPIGILVLLMSLLILLLLWIFGINQLVLALTLGLLVVINSALIGAGLFVLLFLGRTVISFTIGQLFYRYIMRVSSLSDPRHWLGMLVSGVLIYALLINVPLPPMGLIFELVSLLAGIGAVAMVMRNRIDAIRAAGTRAVLVSAPRVLPAPGTALLTGDGVEGFVGMDNLPDGFAGFDEDW
ncbi:MAG: hypothetical protein JW966_15830 [Anaerolineae bacterium]|nr:hypothetical protein [Anaerolineae bacterium]